LASVEYTDHCREILEAQRIFVKYIPTLTSRSDEQVNGMNLDFFVIASKTASQMRIQYKKEHQTQQPQKQSTKTQSRPRRRIDITQKSSS